VIVFGVALALLLGEYARRETVTGRLQPDKGLIEVRPEVAGRVMQVNVAEGEGVSAGALLFRIDRDTVLASGSGLAEQLAAQIEEERRQAERRLSLLADQFASRRAQLHARRDGLIDERARLSEQITVQKNRAALAERLVSQIDRLVRRGIVSQREHKQREDNSLSHAQELAALRARNAAIDREIAELDVELSALPVEQAMQEAEFAERIAALDQRLTETARQGEVVVRAPVAGTVGALLVRPGDPVAAGASALTMLPADGALQAELLVPSRAAGFIAPGQTVRLRYAAFPYKKFGVAKARISTVSRTVVMPADLGLEGRASEPVFRVFADLDAQTVEAYGEAIPLQAGMTLTADIVLEERRLWELLLDPVLAAARR
jgi:membrane fusion protein